ncbi:type II toxin-antitoxin system VapC family toxin [Paraburkholderia dinghuensis]|uniref:PIN domain-containing protein n=1 Tax=Paraburkholderia dinghuensis TaxID=2305225 RepID=A0A3N6PXC2_9BURK|nr:type II toxin-antitoxin system VapC family toxin [Paraburkholderia dinghuensis]RQH07000.1 PIN domain-containing protein [Paraburkholderia dinghuensis]
MITLDTLALVYWLNGKGELGDAAQQAIDNELNGGEILISTITVLDLVQFVEEGCLELSMDTRSWLSTLISIEGVRLVPVDSAIAVRAASMSRELTSHQRLIAATARTLGGTLVTPDARMRELTYVETVW